MLKGYSKDILEEVIYRLNESGPFLLNNKGWSYPTYGFGFDNSRNKKYMDALMKSGVVN